MGERVATLIIEPPSLANAIGYWAVQGRSPFFHRVGHRTDTELAT